MKRFAMLLALYAGSFGPAFALREVTPPPNDEQAAFAYACRVMQYDCSGVEPPGIVWVPELLTQRGESEGAYDGSSYIYMNAGSLRTADPVYVQSVLAHETTHYLDVQLGKITLPYTMENVCESEYNGWRVGNVYLLTHGRPDLVDFEWAQRYRCFR